MIKYLKNKNDFKQEGDSFMNINNREYSIENALRGIEQAFIEYFGEDYRGKIRKVFDELIVVGVSNDSNNGKKLIL